MSELVDGLSELAARRPADHDRIPMCSHLVCPKFDGKRCIETGNEPADVCIPAVKDLNMNLDVARASANFNADQTVRVRAERDEALGEISRMTMLPAAEVIEAERKRLARLDEIDAERRTLKAENERLVARQQELLATIVRVTNETPFADEIKGWEAQRSAMIAEVGTLRAEVDELKAMFELTPDSVRALAYAIRACEYTYNRAKIEAIVNGEDDPARSNVDLAIEIIDRIRRAGDCTG